jgi:hypothetical protein
LSLFVIRRLVGRALGTDLATVMERQADGRTLHAGPGFGC